MSLGRTLGLCLGLIAFALCRKATAAPQAPPPPDTYQETSVALSDKPRSRKTRAQPNRVPLQTRLKLQALGADLGALGARGNSYLIDGIISSAMGATSITLGAFVDDPGLARFMYFYGAVGLVRGGLVLGLTPRLAKPADTFAHWPVIDVASATEKLRFGETTLRQAAKRSRILRLSEASLNVGSGLAFIPLYLVPNDFRFDSALTVFAVVGAGLSLVQGMIAFFSPTRAEQYWSAYRELVQRLEAPGAGLPEVAPSAAETSARAGRRGLDFTFTF